MSDSIDRRTFLEKLFTVSVFGAAVPSLLLGTVTPTIASSGDSVSGTYELDISEFPILQSVGGSIRLTISAISPLFRIIVTRVSETAFEAVNARCPHEGNRVRAANEEGILVCEAHESAYDPDGTYISGPAEGQNLTRYFTSYDGLSTLTVEIPELTDVLEDGEAGAYIAVHSTGPMPNQIVFEYAMRKPARAVLTLYSLSGVEAMRPLDEFRNEGEHRLACDLSPLAKGVYLYRLTTPDGVIGSGKIVIR